MKGFSFEHIFDDQINKCRISFETKASSLEERPCIVDQNIQIDAETKNAPIADETKTLTRAFMEALKQYIFINQLTSFQVISVQFTNKTTSRTENFNIEVRIDPNTSALSRKATDNNLIDKALSATKNIVRCASKPSQKFVP